MSTPTTAALLRQPEALHCASLVHGAVTAALAILEPIHGLATAQRLVGEILSADPPVPVKRMQINRQNPEQLRAQRNAVENRLDDIPVGTAYANERRPLCQQRRALCAQIEAIEALGDGEPRLVVLLDDYASTLVRRWLENGGTSASADDVASGALAFTLGEDDDHDLGEIGKATDRRHGTERREVA